MIYGVGLDSVEVSRIAAAIDEYGEQFIHRIFSDDEIAYCSSRYYPAEHYAARFAAKEALAKALGTGMRNGFRWKESVVAKEYSGKPVINLRGSMVELARNRIAEKYFISVSLSHTKDLAEAIVIIER